MDEIIKNVRSFLKTEGFLTERMVLKDTDSLTETGIIDSIIVLQLVDFLEKKYNIEIPMEMLTPENFDTLEGIERSITEMKQG